ncbi:uncharacterized protein LOC134289063 [Aedes albopictus]|uniref:Reverse transcriptase domain-containing protein n=1 Tax=Aedes albopictus TaxID=7160 RepID=A0ABM1ZJW7_AEDAL
MMEQEQERRKKAMQEKLELEKQFIERKFDLLRAELDEDDDDRSDQLSSVNMIISPPAQSTNQRNSLAACLPQQVGQHQQQKNAGQHQPRQHRESSAFVDTTDTVILASKTLSQAIHQNSWGCLAPPAPPVVSPMPTAQQIAARHVVPKDLPVFSGDPSEWPLFASSYYNSTAMCGYSDGENLMRLQRSLKGNAREAVHCQLLHPASVPQIMMTLQTLFGRPELIVRCLLNKVQSTPAPKADKLESLISFGLAVQNLCSHLQSMGMEAHLSNPTILQELVDKLPTNLKLDWALHQRHLPTVDLSSFGNYMSTIVFAASKVSVGSEPVGKFEKPKGKKKGFLNTHSTEEVGDNDQEERQESSAGQTRTPYTPKLCPVCKKETHKVKDCRSFLEASIDDHWKLVHQANLCRRCLIGHGKWPCKATVCGMDGCELRHHRLLHPGRPESSSSAKDQPKVTGTVGVHRHQSRPTLFRIIPVIVHANGTSVRTLAFLDDGSSYTLVEQDLVDELGVTGELEPLCLQWTSGITRTEANSRLLQIEISGVDANRKHILEDLADKYDYLRGLPVASYDSTVPRILIGVDNADLQVTLKKREGKKFEPVATKTRLGWTIYGNLTRIEAEDERRARAIMEETTIRTSSGRFQTGLLWRNDYVEFPDSRAMAEHRLKCLERRLSKNPELYNNVKQQIKDYQRKGYAHELTKEEANNSDPRRVWYLPLGVVTNPNKPGKVRVVWDAAAKIEGISLNSMLMKGPDMTASLSTVLYRFRQRQIAIAGDIREMFHQIQIRPQDRQAQRFLWRDAPGETCKEYVMDVATFGSTCSPSSAQYIKNRNAEEWSEQYPEAAVAIIECHYVDDYLDSLDCEEEAVRLALDVKTVHAKAGFDIRNWLSNSELVLQRVGDPGQQITKSFTAGKGSETERVLGMSWTPKEDTFTFAVNFRSDIQSLISGTSVPTKRQVLRVVMSVFDPLGLFAVFVIHGKCLVQDIWRTKIGWDDPIPEKLHETWRRWIQVLQQLPQLELPRCYFPNYSVGSLRSLQLHVFVDASETAYSCVAYFLT